MPGTQRLYLKSCHGTQLVRMVKLLSVVLTPRNYSELVDYDYDAYPRASDCTLTLTGKVEC
jgi:hypothetical protein